MERELSLLATAALTAALTATLTATLGTALTATPANTLTTALAATLVDAGGRSVLLHPAATDRRNILLQIAASVDLCAASRSRYWRAAANDGAALDVPARAFDRSAFPSAVAVTPLGRSVAPALPAIFAAPAEVAPPGKAAAIPAGSVPAIEIEAIAVASNNEDRRLLPSGAAALHELEIVPSGGKRKQELGMFGLKRPTRIDLRSNDAAIVVRENGEMELFIRQAKGDEELPPSQVVLALFGMAFHDERVRKLLTQIVKEKQN